MFEVERRVFLAGLCSALAAGSTAGNAQEPTGERPRRVGVLLYADHEDAVMQGDLAAFTEELTSFGWTPEANLHLDVIWASGKKEDLADDAVRLIRRRPDVLVGASAAARPLIEHASPGTPVIFINVSDPIGLGFISDFAHPKGMVTGFYNYDPAMAGKWLEMLKDLVPGLNRVALLGDQSLPAFAMWRHSLDGVTERFSVDVFAPVLQSVADIDSCMQDLSSKPGGGFIVLPSSWISIHRERVVAMAADLRVPGIYPRKDYAKIGGLIAYGIDSTDLFRRTAGYVDHLLRGAKPSDLPVQGASRFDLVINFKTAAALGLKVPPQLAMQATEVVRY